MSHAIIEAEFTDTTGGALVRHSGALTPVQSIDDAITLRAQIVEFTKRIMVLDRDYGTIPGTPKPTLLKPGAEKLCTHFALYDSFSIMEKTEDWTGAQHGGEPFFAYTVKCSLSRNGETISEGVGHCNSWEKKYRYRPVYPNQASEDDKKRGKLVTKMGKNKSTYQVYLVPNEDIFDQVNTFLKMAKKRALIDATLRAVSASEFYTQDIEDIHTAEIVAELEPIAEPPATAWEQLQERGRQFGFTSENPNTWATLLGGILGKKPSEVKAIWTDSTFLLAVHEPDTKWQVACEKMIAYKAKQAEAATAEPVSETLIDVAPRPPADTTLQAMAK